MLLAVFNVQLVLTAMKGESTILLSIHVQKATSALL